MWQLDTMLYLLAHSRNYGIYIYIVIKLIYYKILFQNDQKQSSYDNKGLHLSLNSQNFKIIFVRN